MEEEEDCSTFLLILQCQFMCVYVCLARGKIMPMPTTEQVYITVFELIGKSHYHGQKRAQVLRCAIL